MIIDAGYPYKNPQGKFICTVKVVDHTYHHKGETPTFATVIIYAKRLDDLPVVTTVGDIIRIHRATMKQYHEQKQFHVNVFFNSSWCLFRTQTDTGEEAEALSDQEAEEARGGQDEEMVDEERANEREQKRKYRPYKFSGKTYTFDMNHEKAILDDLRNWTLNYFAKEYVITKDMYKLLKDLKTGDGTTSEFDLLVKILKVFEKDDNSLELRIKDISQKMYEMTVPRLKFHPSVLRQGEIVRVRCVELNMTTKRDVIQIKPYTNILRIH